MAVGDFTTFAYTGSLQTMQLIKGKIYRIECWGAQGGSNVVYNGTVITKAGGKGGYAVGEIEVSTNTDINIYVGGQPTSIAGGWNGGGNGYMSYSMAGSGGGGASDVRIGGTALANRVIVAGGGGGSTSETYGGGGGGLVGIGGGIFSSAQSIGGSQSAGGANGGALGQGGNSIADYGCAGGGGGYYGGGGSRENYSGGAGGSSYIGGMDAGTTAAERRTGHGQIVITEIPNSISLTEPTTFSFTGYPHIASLPAGRYKLECYGAKGGNGSYSGQTDGIGGNGGYCVGELTLLSKTALYLYPGGKGASWSAGGWNGGGASGESAGSGGGGTDIRIGGIALENRIISAGGGGGGRTGGCRGGDGGGLFGDDGEDNGIYPGGAGGTQTIGTLGIGAGNTTAGRGAGGGGYRGGDCGSIGACGGGGSSNYGTLENGITTKGLNTGDGYIIITPLTIPYGGFPQII